MKKATRHITKHGMFQTRQKSDNPSVIIRKEDKYGRPTVEAGTVQGRFYRVSPSTAREIFAIQYLEHQHDKYSPSEGDGVILSEAALAKLDAK
jgi:hypothetical protein